MRWRDVLASIQIIVYNPILKASKNMQIQYFMYLRSLLRLGRWDKRKYTKAQITFYREKLCGEQENIEKCRNITLDSCYSYLLPFDLAAMLAFDKKLMPQDKIAKVVEKIVIDFGLPVEDISFFESEFRAALGEEESWKDVILSKTMMKYRDYLNLIKDNIAFVKMNPYNILITATMSAGKSTLINALVGKNISLMQNMACTSKNHTIISKRFEDGVTSEYDYDILMNASREDLLVDNTDNKTVKITVGTYFNGMLGGNRIILFDTPGVNSSENVEHMEISQKMIRARKYNLMMYVLNATQLGTTDDEKHLEIVAKQIGRTKVIFVLNKIDQLITEDENIFDVMERQRKFLVSKGFRNPIICPVSARAAYLVKKSQTEELSRLEYREIENYMDKFEDISLAKYYEEQLKCNHIASSRNEMQRLLQNCGFAYFENIIKHFYNGGKTNGTSIC